MTLKGFREATGLSTKTAHWVHKYLNMDNRDFGTGYRDFTQAEVDWVLARKLENFLGEIREVPEFGGKYYISTNGIVYNYSRGILKEMAGYITQGYRYIVLRKDNVQKRYKVARLMAITYLPNPENKPVVNHINGDKSDDRLENLEWNTYSENTKHGYATGLSRNDSGFEDSQSIPVVHMTTTGNVIGVYGSINAAAKALGYYKTRIARSAETNSIRYKNGEKIRSKQDDVFIYYDVYLEVKNGTK